MYNKKAKQKMSHEFDKKLESQSAEEPVVNSVEFELLDSGLNNISPLEEYDRYKHYDPRWTALVGMPLSPAMTDLMLNRPSNLEHITGDDTKNDDRNNSLHFPDIVSDFFEKLDSISDLEQLMTLEAIALAFRSSEIEAIASDTSTLFAVEGNINHDSENVGMAREALHVRLCIELADNLLDFTRGADDAGVATHALKLSQRVNESLEVSLVRVANAMEPNSKTNESLDLPDGKDEELIIDSRLNKIYDYLERLLPEDEAVSLSQQAELLKNKYMAFEVSELDLENLQTDPLVETYLEHFDPELEFSVFNRNLIEYVIQNPETSIPVLSNLFGDDLKNPKIMYGLGFLLNVNKFPIVKSDALLEKITEIETTLLKSIIEDIAMAGMYTLGIEDEMMDLHKIDRTNPSEGIYDSFLGHTLFRGLRDTVLKRVTEIVTLISNDTKEPIEREVRIYTKDGPKLVIVDNPKIYDLTLSLFTESLGAIYRTIKYPRVVDTPDKTSSTFRSNKGSDDNSHSTITFRQSSNENGGARIGFNISFENLPDSFIEYSASIFKSAGLSDSEIGKMTDGTTKGRERRKLNLRLDLEESGGISFDIGSTYRPGKQPVGLVMAVVASAAAQLFDLQSDNHAKESYRNLSPVSKEDFAKQVGSVVRLLNEKI